VTVTTITEIQGAGLAGDWFAAITADTMGEAERAVIQVRRRFPDLCIITDGPHIDATQRAVCVLRPGTDMF